MAITYGVKHGPSVSVSGVTDGGSNSFTDTGLLATNATTGIAVGIWYKQNASANAAATFTATTGSAAYPAIVVSQFSGVATSSAYDTGATGAGAPTALSVTSGSFTPAQAAAVAIAFAQENSNGGVWSPDTGYTTAADAGTANEVYGQYKITLATTGQTVTATNDIAQSKSIAVAVFKEAAGGGGGGSTTNLFYRRRR